MPVTITFISLGANLPGPYDSAETSVRAAYGALNYVTSLNVRCSRFFRTPAFPPGSGPEFVNAVVELPWQGTAQDLLLRLKEIEQSFGRTRNNRWEARVLDLDILAFGDTVLPDPETEAHWRTLSPERARVETPGDLIIPHPRLAERAFVLVPMMDVAPDWIHPVLGLSVRQMCAALPASERAQIRPV